MPSQRDRSTHKLDENFDTDIGHQLIQFHEMLRPKGTTFHTHNVAQKTMKIFCFKRLEIT